MKVLIIEDEQMAQATLARNLSRNFPEMEIVGMTSSVQESVDWLKQNQPDVIFMDVELSDGICFEIFRQVEVKADVIMTTAYDNYAVKAFEQGSIDYLLKPIEPEALQRAVSRIRSRAARQQPDWASLVNTLQQQIQSAQTPSLTAGKERFTVKFNDKIVPVKTTDIAYFYSEDKYNYLVTTSGAVYIADSSLDEIVEVLNPDTFFKISRSCIVSIQAIVSITKLIGGRLQITPSPKCDFDMVVSRSRADEFLTWLER